MVICPLTIGSGRDPPVIDTLSTAQLAGGEDADILDIIIPVFKFIFPLNLRVMTITIPIAYK